MIENINWIRKLIGWVCALFWKNKDLIYINSTKKIFDQSEIDGLRKTKNVKWIVNESKTNKIGFKFKKSHFTRMKYHLYQIQRNLNESPKISYAGYASVPFAVFDGYCLGDNHEYLFFDTTKDKNATYKIQFSKERKTENNFNVEEVEEVDLLISSSYKVNKRFAKTGYVFEYDKQINDKVSAEYLSDIFYFVSDFLDACRVAGVNKVNLYCSSRQPVSFVIGTAIQAHHPQVIVYEFEKNNYDWCINIQNAKLNKGNSL